LFDKPQTNLIQFPAGLGGTYTIPTGVVYIGESAFAECTNLVSVTIPYTVTTIGYEAFWYCLHLLGVYFQGNAPNLEGVVFYNFDNKPTIYYLPGTVGWGTTFGNQPTAQWFLPNPLILNYGSAFGVRSNQFGFTISWATNGSVVIEGCTDLANPVWTPLVTNALTGGSFYFSDPAWRNFPVRAYRVWSP
jgi:hypothetical protein